METNHITQIKLLFSFIKILWLFYQNTYAELRYRAHAKNWDAELEIFASILLHFTCAVEETILNDNEFLKFIPKLSLVHWELPKLSRLFEFFSLETFQRVFENLFQNRFKNILQIKAFEVFFKISLQNCQNFQKISKLFKLLFQISLWRGCSLYQSFSEKFGKFVRVETFVDKSWDACHTLGISTPVNLAMSYKLWAPWWKTVFYWALAFS